MDEWLILNHSKYPKWMAAVGPLRWSERAYDRSYAALGAFVILGPIAEPAIPELRSRLNDTDFHRATLAFGSLMSIGPAAIPLAIDVISNPGTNLHRYADNLQYLINLGTNNVEVVVSTILKNLQHTNTEIAVATSDGLGWLYSNRSKEITSALTNALVDPRIELRRAVLIAIMLHGDESALPALTNALSDPDAQVRASAKSAIDGYNW